MEIEFIQTGGTIDKDYGKGAGTFNFKISEPAVRRILEKIDLNLKYNIKSVLKKDSLNIKPEEREKIYEACKNSEKSKLIVSHGTDTMIKTAKKLSKIKDKTIVLVGASKPERFGDSDANFNVGTAVGAINVLDRGTYIAMNGRIYRWDKCKKNKKTGRFIEK